MAVFRAVLYSIMNSCMPPAAPVTVLLEAMIPMSSAPAIMFLVQQKGMRERVQQ